MMKQMKVVARGRGRVRLLAGLAAAVLGAAVGRGQEPMTLDAFRVLSVEDPRARLTKGEEFLASEWASHHPDWQREVLLRMARAATLLADPAAVAEAAARLERLATAGDAVAGAYARLVRAGILADAGRAADALELATAAATTLRGTGEPRWAALAESELCHIAVSILRADLAERYCREGRRLWEGLGDPFQLARMDNYLALVASQKGNPQEAIRLGTRARELFARAGMPSLVFMMDDNLAGFYLAAGQPALALPLSTAALRREEASGKQQHAVASRANIAHALALLGRHEEARATIARAIEDAIRIGYDVALPSLYEVQMRVGKAAGDSDLVWQAATSALEAQARLAEAERARAAAEAETRYRAAVAEAEVARLDARVARQRFRLTAVAISGGSLAIICVLLVLLLRAGRRRERELAVLSSTDALTGAASRRAFVATLESVYAAAPTAPPSALLIVDADRFKEINDRYGHAAGDEVLRQVVARLRGEVRAADAVGRLGGEEFGVLLRAVGREEAVRRAEAIRAAVSNRPVDFEGQALRLTVSVGVALLDVARLPSVERWLAAADAALYEAKRRGRNRVVAAP